MPNDISGATALSLEGETYWSPEHYRREIELFWRPGWRFVCHESEISEPGSYFRYDLDRDSVVVVRGTDGAIRGFHNVCRHRGSPLVKEESGKCRERLVCPFHGWSYDFDGRLRITPNMHRGFDSAGWNLKPVWTEVWLGCVFISLARERPRAVAERLAGADFSGYDMDQVRVARTREDIVEGNWKLAWEGGIECYHCPLNHPGLIRIQPFDDYGDQLNARVIEEFDYIPDRPVFPEFRKDPTGPGIRHADNPARGSTVMQWHLGVFEIFAGHRSVGMMSFRPLGPTRTAIRMLQLVPKTFVEGVDYTEANFELSRKVRDEDNALVELVQRGVQSSAYEPGPFNQRLEAANRVFSHVYVKAMNGEM